MADVRARLDGEDFSGVGDIGVHLIDESLNGIELHLGAQPTNELDACDLAVQVIKSCWLFGSLQRVL